MADPKDVLVFHDLQAHPPLSPLELKEPCTTDQPIEAPISICCGISCVHDEKKPTCCHTWRSYCGYCLSQTTSCFSECVGDWFACIKKYPWVYVRLLVFCAVIGVGAYLIYHELSDIMYCDGIYTAYRYDCFLRDYKQSLELYAFGIWLIVVGGELFIVNIVHGCNKEFEDSHPNDPSVNTKPVYKCTNGIPNCNLLCRLLAISLLLLHLGLLYLPCFYGPVYMLCDEHDGHEDPNCKESSMGVGAGAIAGGLFSGFSLFLALILACV